MKMINTKQYQAGYRACLKSNGTDVWSRKHTPSRSWNRGYNECFAEHFAMEFVEDIHRRFPAPNKPQDRPKLFELEEE